MPVRKLAYHWWALDERGSSRIASRREHARQGGFPADRISEIVTVISPATAEKPNGGPLG
jgi:hypothetical protein